MKEVTRENEELRASTDNAVAMAKDIEKKLKGMEADTLHLQEVLADHQLTLAPPATAWFCLLNSIPH